VLFFLSSTEINRIIKIWIETVDNIKEAWLTAPQSSHSERFYSRNKGNRLYENKGIQKRTRFWLFILSCPPLHCVRR